MQFHHNDYVTGDPRIKPANLGRSLGVSPGNEVDVLIVGVGPAAVITAAQLGVFPHVTTRIIERNPEKLKVGRADGLGARSAETFYAFGFAERILQEAQLLNQITFYGKDPKDPSKVIKESAVLRRKLELSEYMHFAVNQARLLDYFVEFMENSPARISPEYGLEFLELTIHDEGEYPVESRIKKVADGSEFTIRSKYVLGADGAFSRVRECIGWTLDGKQANHAWGVVDGIFLTDFPDIRTRTNVASQAGGILMIPREGGFLTRFYIDLGEVDGTGEVRKTPLEQVLDRAKQIVHPYTLELKDLAWFSVYEVGHRITQKYDNLPVDDEVNIPRVFNAGDACHTHSAKAGQGMNVSMQDGWNLAWKLGYVIEGWADPSLLRSYDAERRQIGHDLIDFDTAWSAKMADEKSTATSLAEAYEQTALFQSGVGTEYRSSVLTGVGDYQDLATGFPLGQRFHSAKVMRVCDKEVVQLGRQHDADGRYRIYVFADQAHPNDKSSAVWKLGEWLLNDSASPLNRYGGGEEKFIDRFDVKVVYRQDGYEINVTDAHPVFRAKSGKWLIPNYELIYAQGKEYRGHIGEDDFELRLFEQRGISKDGAVVIVRPDQYVGEVLPLDAYDRIAAYFDGILI